MKNVVEARSGDLRDVLAYLPFSPQPVTESHCCNEWIERLEAGHNQSYWFTTWRWSTVLGAILLIGTVIKLSILA